MSSGVIVVGALDVLFVATAIELLDIGARAGFLSAAFVRARSSVRRRPSRSSDDAASRRRCRWAVLFGAPIGLVAIAPSAVSARSCSPRPGRDGASATCPVAPCCNGSRRTTSSRVFGVLEGLTMLALVIGSVGAAILIEAYGVQAALVVVGAFLPVVILLVGTPFVDRPIRRGARHRAPSPPARYPRRCRAPAMERVLADMFPIEVPDGAVLIWEGDPGDLFYVIVEGRVEIHAEVSASRAGTAHVGEIACCATSGTAR